MRRDPVRRPSPLLVGGLLVAGALSTGAWAVAPAPHTSTALSPGTTGGSPVVAAAPSAQLSPRTRLPSVLPLAEGTQECTPGVPRYVDQAPAVLSQLGLSEAWALSSGAVLVAVVDSGVDARNAHLTQAVAVGTDLVDGGDGWRDDSGHGTAVAGQIAAREVTGSGVVGVAPQAVILPVRVYADTSEESVREGRGPDALRTAEGITWAADNGAVVIAVPQSTPSDVPELRAAVEYATRAGALVVASAGNASDDQQGASVRFPAGYPQALSVTAVDAQGHPSDALLHGVHVELAAPGSQVLTTFLDAGDCLLAADTPTASYATGTAAGVAALVASAHPQEGPADWEYRMLATALRPTPASRDNLIGWGIVAPYDALNMVNDGSLPGPPNPRFPAPVQTIAPVMPRPTPTPDPLPGRRPGLALLGGGGLTALAVVLMVARLRRPR